MKKVIVYSALLLAGLFLSQILPRLGPEIYAPLAMAIKLTTMFCLAFLMIRVGHEFDIDKSNLRQYGWDYVVAATAAAFPWIFCALYFVWAMSPSTDWFSAQTWKDSLLVSRFAAPTSAGVLFAMLAAAGLGATWVFKKARILAIFDDLDTVLLMIPLKALMIGMRWQLGAIILAIGALLWAAWKYLHQLRAPTGWAWLLVYAGLITALCEGIYISSKLIDDVVPIHLEVLLPAFVLGCMLYRRDGEGDHAHEGAGEQRASTAVTSVFMLFVGLSMPLIAETSGAQRIVGGPWPGWGWIAAHVVIVTVISNLGKMFSAFCYRKEATLRERLAVSIGMFPRGEVGAGVLAVSLSYGLGGAAVTVAMLSLALNLVLTGVFIAVVRRLLNDTGNASSQEPGYAR